MREKNKYDYGCFPRQTQAFAIEIVVRGLVITKILYMIECYKNLKDRRESGLRKQGMDFLEHAEPIGSV